MLERSSLRHFVLLFALSTAVASTVGAATLRDDVANSVAVANSANATYAPTGFVSVNIGGGSFVLGSGVLIAPDWVVTAAHVVTSMTGTTANPGASPYAAAQVTFGQGAAIPTNTLTGTYGVSQIVTAPGWNYDYAEGDDLALIHLTTSVANVTPAKLFTSSLGSEKTLKATLVGYGLTGNGTTGAVTQDLVRRATTNTIDAFGGDTTSGPTGGFSLAGLSSNILFEDFDNPLNANNSSMGAAAPTTFEGLSGEGDSGGGLYVDVSGQTYIAGITSFGTVFTNFSGSINSGYGDIAGFTRITPFSSFIAATVPEPAASIGVGAFLVAAARRRRSAPGAAAIGRGL